MKAPDELSGQKQAGRVFSRRLPRLSIQLEKPKVDIELKKQVRLCIRKTKKAWINDLLELVLIGPTVFKKNRMDDMACMLGIFRSLPMDEIRKLAKETQRSPEQMFTRILLKGLASYSSDLAKGNFD